MLPNVDPVQNFATWAPHRSIRRSMSCVRFVASEGFAKLLACGRLEDAAVLWHLIMQQFMPATKDDIAVRQRLSVFFPAFVASGTDRAMMLARELIPTLRLVEVQC